MSEWSSSSNSNNNNVNNNNVNNSNDESIVLFALCNSEFDDQSSDQKLTTSCSSSTTEKENSKKKSGTLYDSNTRGIGSLREIKKDLMGNEGSEVKKRFAELFPEADFDSFFDLFAINFFIEQEDNAKDLQEQWGEGSWLDVIWNGRSLYVHCKPFFMLDFDNDCSASEFHLHRWSVHPAFAGCGFTLAAIERVLISAAKLSIPYCLADAIGRPGEENGYYTWVRYGFDGLLKDCHEAFFKAAGKLLISNTTLGFFFDGDNPRDPEDTNNLLALWRELGSTIVTEFLLKKGSLSWSVFREYQKTRSPYDPQKLDAIYGKYCEEMEMKIKQEKEDSEKEAETNRKRKEEEQEQAKLNQSLNKNNNNNNNNDSNFDDSDWE